jgi:hypothetical protein
MIHFVFAASLFIGARGVEALCPAVSTDYKALVCEDRKQKPPRGRKHSDGKDTEKGHKP